MLACVGEIGIEIRVERDNLGDVPVEFLNQRHVFDHVVWHPRLLVLVHLLNQVTVTVKHRLNLPEALVQCGPHLRIPLLRLVVGIHRGCCGGSPAPVVLLGTVFHSVWID